MSARFECDLNTFGAKLTHRFAAARLERHLEAWYRLFFETPFTYETSLGKGLYVGFYTVVES